MTRFAAMALFLAACGAAPTRRLAEPIRIDADGAVLDLRGAVLVGGEGDPDTFEGSAIVVEGRRNVTIRNAVIRGFKVAIRAVDCDGLTIENCDVSGNYRQRLRSTPRAEAGEDWLYGHENDANEWLRYGAGIWVESSRNVTISRNRARHGQNGICLVRVDDSAVIDNDMSFMSGWGLAMWRSSRNDVSNNKFDWCIRGFSRGVYHRGQDSAGILVYEQCSDNVFAYNSATHGGDGFFLYAGNETLHGTGEGGCNRNLLYRNDFSHAAANGIEATFSEGNAFVENRLEECDHGIWAGYSSDTLILGNSIARCNHGVSIEHGHDNRIEGNAFEACGVGVNAWWDDDADLLKTKFGTTRDTGSHGYTIVHNTFRDLKGPAVRLDGTTDVRVDRAFEGDVEAERVDVEPSAVTAPRTRGTQDAFLPEGAARGYGTIFVDEWGPYDFSDLRVFGGPSEFYALGPAADFRVVDVTGGVEVSPRDGRLPTTLSVTAGPGARAFEFAVESGGGKATVSGFLVNASWDVRFYRWEYAGPQKPPADWQAVVAADPFERLTADRIDFAWGGGGPGDLFATTATTELELPAGRYALRTVSDDGVRVLVDGRAVVEDWTWHPPKEDRAVVELAAGVHAIRIEHFEIDGAAQLQFEIAPER